MNPIEPSIENLKAYLNELDELHTNYSDMIFVLDLNDGKSLSSEFRIEYGKWLKKNVELIKATLTALVLVNKSLVMNFMIKGVFLIQSPPVPYTIVPSI